MKRTEFSSHLLREKYFLVEHDSGLPIYVFPKKLTGIYALFATKYGSVDSTFLADGVEITVPDGIAHFLEHKLFENTDGSDSFSRFSALGADANAYTSYQRTAYLFSCTEHFEESLEELLTFVTNPYFTEQSVKKEQGIIAEEIRMYEDSPWDRCQRLLLCALYHEHPVRKNICGSPTSIRKITPELLYRCHRVFYDLSNMALVVCGDVTVEQVLSIADRVLPQKKVSHSVERILPEEPPRVAKRSVECRMQVSKPLFSIGVKDPVIPSDPKDRLRRDAAMTLLDEILFSRSGELYNTLFEEGIITPSFFSGYSCTDSFAYHCVSGESDTPETVLERIKAYISEVIEKGIDKEVFERCRRVLYSDELRAYDSTEEIANRLLSFVFDDAEMFSYPELLQDITLTELEELLKDSFLNDYFAISIVYPLEDERKENEQYE